LVARLCDPQAGNVWKAVDQRSDREVAVKILPDLITDDDELFEQFTRDNRTVATGLHPNIVRVHAIESIGDSQIVSMDLVDGKTLDKHVPSGGLGPEAFVALGTQLTDALRVAHDNGVIHRALNPANVMVRDDGVVQVLNFGLAAIRELDDDPEIDTDDIPTLTMSLTGEGEILDTLPYMSPEQIRGRPLDARSDVFSVGAILYEMATGQRAFQGQAPADIIVGILRDQPQGVTKLNRAMSPLHGQLVFHCLAKPRDRRFQSVNELHEALRSLND
jgi:serine/threonine protein kinase